MQIVNRLWRSESVLDCKMQCDEVNMYMFVFLCSIHFSPLIKGMKKKRVTVYKKGRCGYLFTIIICVDISMSKYISRTLRFGGP